MTVDDSLHARARQARSTLLAEERRHAVPAPMASRRRGHRRATPLFALLGLAVALVAVGVLVGGELLQRSVVRPGVMTSVSAGSRPVDVVTDGRVIVVADVGPGTVTAYDVDSLTPRWVSHEAVRPLGLALGNSALWVLDTSTGRLLALDLADGRLVTQARTSTGAVDVATTPGLVWVLSPDNRTLDKYDAVSVSQVGSVLVDATASAVSAGSDALWVVSPDAVNRVALDATRGAGTTRVPLPGRPVQVAVDAASVWITLTGGQLLRLDPADPSVVRSRTSLDATPTALTTLDDGSAVVATSAGTLRRVPVSGPPSALPAAGGAVTSLASSGALLVGASSSLAQLYATEVSP